MEVLALFTCMLCTGLMSVCVQPHIIQHNTTLSVQFTVYCFCMPPVFGKNRAFNPHYTSYSKRPAQKLCPVGSSVRPHGSGAAGVVSPAAAGASAIVPKEVKEGRDGVLITLDSWQESEKNQQQQHQTPCQIPHQVGRCLDPKQQEKQTRIAASFVTRNMTVFMANQLLVPRNNGEYALQCKVHENQFDVKEMEVHAKIIEVDKDRNEHFRVAFTVSFKTGKRDVHYSHSYQVELSAINSNISEVHAPNKQFYIHGVRQLLNSFAWYLCKQPTPHVDERVSHSILHPTMTLQQALKLICNMQLKILVPPLEAKQQHEEYMSKQNVKTLRQPLYAIYERSLSEETNGILKAMNIQPMEATTQALYDLTIVKTCLDPRANTRNWRSSMQAVQKTDTLEQGPEGGNMDVDGYQNVDARRKSVYPIGSLVARHGFCIHQGPEVGEYISTRLPRLYPKEKVGRILLGAYAACELGYRFPHEHYENVHFLEVSCVMKKGACN